MKEYYAKEFKEIFFKLIFAKILDTCKDIFMSSFHNYRIKTLFRFFLLNHMSKKFSEYQLRSVYNISYFSLEHQCKKFVQTNGGLTSYFFGNSYTDLKMR